MIIRVTALGAAVLVMTASCGGSSGSTPTSPEQFMAVSCNQTSLLAGDYAYCTAKIGSTNVGWDPAAMWTSSDPSVARSEGIGLFMGRSTGQAALSVTYAGVKRSALVTVSLRDMINVSGGASQGPFQVGGTPTLYLQGGYGVASADSGTLSLIVENQAGTVIHRSAPKTLPRGGDHYIISTSLTLPPGTARICRKAMLQIGSTILTAVPAEGVGPCFDVDP